VRPDEGRVERAADVTPAGLQKLYQDPAAAFAPRVTLRRSLGDLVKRHRLAWPRLEALLARLRIDPTLLERLPQQVSGGELQRIALARVLMLDPALIFADEPTSRLDPVTQRETMSLLLDSAAERGYALVLVTHHPDLTDKVATRSFALA
jgi:peptide/nickel transport system ATP-binding protein